MDAVSLVHELIAICLNRFCEPRYTSNSPAIDQSDWPIQTVVVQAWMGRVAHTYLIDQVTMGWAQYPIPQYPRMTK